MKIVFQHLETISHKQDIIVVGRTEKNKSVAVILNDVKPNIIINHQPNITNKIIHIVKFHRFWKKYKKRSCNGYAPNKTPHDMKHTITFEILEGQDIIDFKEDTQKKFIKITCENMWDYYLVKRIVKQYDISIPTIYQHG